ncbi:MAG: asparagine synthase C-terminal domain-containing protein [Bacteroidia bacterium]|nr:asparagine synthase C-terminal domain-containing protein [Bacteroidia bacterium]
MKLYLSKLPWFNREDIWVTGFILSEGKFLRNEELLNYFLWSATLSVFEEKVKSANGQFSVVISKADEIWTATDRLRNWPLFYTHLDGQFILSDDCYKLAEIRKGNQFDPAAVSCFLASGYVINNHTLLKDIYQVEAGSLLILGAEAKSHFYHSSCSGTVISKDLKTGAEELNEMLHNLFKEYFNALKNKFIAIPLSGGYDSRLVALMASKYHPENVLCYTYGREDNPEVALAMETARRLRLKWINIIYNTELINDFIHDGFFKDYFPWVSDLNGMFFLQEYFAVRYLKTNRIIPEDSVFISGYSGDFIAGSYLTPEMKKCMDEKELSEIISNEYFRMVKLEKLKRSEIYEMIGERIPSGKYDAWRIIESWDMKERHSKFIINSAKVFTYFGYEYVFPLWDNRLVDYMLPLPYELRMDRKLYEHTLRDHIFREYNLNLDNETNPAPVNKSYQRLKEMIKPFLPSLIKNLFINHYNAILYDEITKILLHDMDQSGIIAPRQPNYYNSYIIQWYLEKTAERFNLKPIQ